MKKNIVFIATLFIGAMLLSSFTTNVCKNNSNREPSVTVKDCQSNIVFRGTQKLRARDGAEIYFYQSGKCEMYQNDRLVVSCTYDVDGNEVKLLDENGNTVYKGRVTYSKQDRTKVASVTIAGTTYYRNN